MTNESLKNYILSKDATVIAVAPFIAYILAYVYEFAFSRSIGVPHEFIHIPMERMLHFSILLIFPVTLGLFLYSIAAMLAEVEIGKVRIAKLMPNARGFSSAVLSICFSVFFIYLLENVYDTSHSMWSIIVLMLFSFAFLTLAELFYRKRKEGKDRLDDYFIELLKYIVALMFVSAYSGMIHANEKEWFYTSSGNDAYLVLKKSGDVLISREYDSDTNEFTDSILIEKASDGPIPLKLIKINRADSGRK